MDTELETKIVVADCRQRFNKWQIFLWAEGGFATAVKDFFPLQAKEALAYYEKLAARGYTLDELYQADLAALRREAEAQKNLSVYYGVED